MRAHAGRQRAPQGRALARAHRRRRVLRGTSRAAAPPRRGTSADADPARQAAKAYEKHCEENGKPDSHAKAKEILAGFAGAFVDRMVETKGVRCSILVWSVVEGVLTTRRPCSSTRLTTSRRSARRRRSTRPSSLRRPSERDVWTDIVDTKITVQYLVYTCRQRLSGVLLVNGEGERNGLSYSGSDEAAARSPRDRAVT